MKKAFISLYVFLLFTSLFAQDTLRVATYNTLKFPENESTFRIPYIRKVIRAMDPDILLTQELTSKNGVALFLENVLNYNNNNQYAAAPFVDGFDTDNMLFYKKETISLLANRQIPTNIRDISEYVIKYARNKQAPKIRLYSVHLKASDSGTDVQKRLNDSRILREELNTLPADAYFLVAGDFNFYNASEPGFIMLTGSQENNAGRCFDPANKPGNWHSNRLFAALHSQSTRTTSLKDDGTAGGLDDRFDFIFVSDDFLQTPDFYCLTKTYQAFGNDGKHLNLNINQDGNASVPDSIADALYYASDHLPVCMDIVWNITASVSNDEPVSPQNVHLFSNYPNPFNSSTVITYTLNKPGTARIEIFNIHGERVDLVVQKHHEPGKYKIHYRPGNLSSGIYFVQLRAAGEFKTRKMLYTK